MAEPVNAASPSAEPQGLGDTQEEFIAPGTDDTTDFEDEGYDAASTRSELASLTSSLLRGVTENGRTYASHGKQEYQMPMDEAEMDRIDMAHAKYFILLDKQRFLAPIGETPQKVLDLGTGTGLWSIDFADQYPSAEVVGVDIAPMQPRWLPPNCRFEIDDIEAEWTWQEECFDYIFARDLIFSVRDFPKLINQCYSRLKPGGWIEFQSIYGVLGCDDGSLPEDGAFKKYDRYIREAAEHVKTPLDDPGKFKEWFEAVGFDQCVERKFKMPSNPWAKEERLKIVGAFERENFVTGLEGMSLRIFQNGLGWTPEETTVYLSAVRKEICNSRYHAYYPFYVVYGHKPERPGL